MTLLSALREPRFVGAMGSRTLPDTALARATLVPTSSAMDRILACVDHSPVTLVVVEQAARLATMSKARLTILHVAPADPEWVGYDVGPQTVRDAVAHELRDEHRATQALAEALRTRSIDAQALTVQGPTVDRILEQAHALDVDVLVIGAHRHGPIRELFVGSIARQVIHRTVRPVLVVPAPD